MMVYTTELYILEIYKSVGTYTVPRQKIGVNVLLHPVKNYALATNSEAMMSQQSNVFSTDDFSRGLKY